MQIASEKLFRFGNLELLARQVVEGFITGLHKSPFHGFSVEFAEHRLYNKGESTRHIDWKLFARTDKLFIKRYEEETNLRCQILLDASSSMYLPENGDMPNKMEFSVLAAASLMELLRRQRDAVGLQVFADTLLFGSQVKSSSVHIQSLYRELEKCAQKPSDIRKTELGPVLHEMAERIHRRSLVIIFSDMFYDFGENGAEKRNALLESLRHLRHAKHEVILFQVSSKQQELDFAFENRPYHFIDAESGREIKVHANEVKDMYRKKIQEYHHALKLECGRLNIDFVDAAVEEGYFKVLSTFMVRRQRMF